MTVLVADDEELMRRHLERSLSGEGYRVVHARDGHEAWRLLGRPGIDVALLDVSMPGAGGIELTRRLRERPPDAYLPVILVTGSTEPHDVERGLDAGADDYIAKPFDARDLRARIRNVLRIRRMEIELRRSHKELRHHLEAARELQLAFLPRSPLLLAHARLAWACEPSHYVAGDILGVLDRGSAGVGFYVADIAGHGVPAAMLSIWVNRELDLTRRDAPMGSLPDPAHVCGMLEARLQTAQAIRYVACTYAVLEPASGLLRYCRCGLPYPMVLRCGGGLEVLRDGGGPPLGLGLAEGLGEEEVNLTPGDRFFIYSDGLLDALERPGFDGEGRVASALAESAHLTVDGQVAELLRLARSGPLPIEGADDVTVMGLELI